MLEVRMGLIGTYKRATRIDDRLIVLRTGLAWDRAWAVGARSVGPDVEAAAAGLDGLAVEGRVRVRGHETQRALVARQ